MTDEVIATEIELYIFEIYIHVYSQYADYIFAK